VKELKKTENKIIDGIEFHLSKYLENDFIIKKIDFTDNGVDYHFTEKVQTLTLEDFDKMLKQSGFTIFKKFGNYHLEDFSEYLSERLIIVAQKNA
jgi:hypothetical protein